MVRGQQQTYAPRIAQHRRADLEQLDPDGGRAGAFQLGALECQAAQVDHQRVGQGRKQQTQLVGCEVAAAAAATEQVDLRLLDAVLRFAASAVQVFVQRRGAPAFEAGAWALKESLRALWDCRHEREATEFWKRWYFWATHSRLPPMIAAAKMVARHLPNVMTYFKHRISNAMAEGLNSKIATIQKRACGYRNASHFKIAVYFHCGGLDLWPQRWTHAKVG
jgi:hypothetical protein